MFVPPIRCGWTIPLPLMVSVALLMLTGSISAQVASGRLEVRLIDPNNAPIADEVVTITNEDTRQSQRQKTSQEGIALFVDVQPGSYTVTAANVPAKGVQVWVAETRLVTLIVGPTILGVSPTQVTRAPGDRSELVVAGQPREFQFTLIVRFHNGFTK